MLLKVISADEYNRIMQDLNALKKENEMLKGMVNKPGITFKFTSNINKVLDLDIVSNTINFSRDVQEAFMKYVNDLLVPIKEEIKTELKSNQSNESYHETVINKYKLETKTILKFVETKIQELYDYCDKVEQIYNKPKYIKLIHADDCKYYLSNLRKMINKLENSLPKSSSYIVKKQNTPVMNNSTILDDPIGDIDESIEYDDKNINI